MNVWVAEQIFPWHFSYKTSSAGSDGHPVDILHDFYIPALTLVVVARPHSK
jgi:hypothetical protein